MDKPFYWNNVARNIIIRAANISPKIAINDIYYDFHKLFVAAQQYIFLAITFLILKFKNNAALIF